MSAKYDIFISYRRDGGEYTAKILRDRLEELGYKVFFDVESLRSGDFNTKLYSVIDECGDFLIILSPNALDRCENQDDWVRCELEYALQTKKNLVPIMLRGFSFPQTLPDSIDALRYKNGLEANTQFFDAFIDRLQQFFVSKPTVVGRVVQNSLFRKTLPVLIALLIAIALGLGANYALGMWNQTFPRTAEEKNVTSEVIYYAGSHLIHLDQMAAVVDSALSAAQRYLISGSEETYMQDAFQIAYQMLESRDLDTYAPADDFIGRISALRDAPFPTADVIAMHNTIVLFQSEWTENLIYIQRIVDSDTPMSSNTRQSILESYQTILSEELKANAYNSNILLLPITERSALREFQSNYLPMLAHVPLSPVSWSTDKTALESASDACTNRIQEAIMTQATLVGNKTIQNDALRENLIQSYMSTGMSREEAEQYVENRLQLKSVFQDMLPAEGDDEDTLWYKLARLVGAGYYDGAQECLTALEELADPADQDAWAYLPALRLFVTAIAPLSDIDYGVMVVGWADPDMPNEVYRIGDIIVSVNGDVCRTYEEYRTLKAALTEDAFNVIVIRLDDEGNLETAVLELEADMPPVHMRTLSDYGYYDK